MTDSPDQTLALARTAAGAVRSLNHATLGGQGLGQPADAYGLLGELSQAAAGLQQPSPPAGSAATTAPTPPERSAAPGCSSPVPAPAPQPWPATSARPSSSSPPSTAR